MRQAVIDLIDEIRDSRHHILVIGGNIFDMLPIGSKEKTFPSLMDFLKSMTDKKFPQFITYDLFSGLNFLRGEKTQILEAMGLGPPKPPANTGGGRRQDANDDIAEAIMEALKGNTQDQLPRDPGFCFSAIHNLLHNTTAPSIVVIDYADTLLRESAVNQGNSNALALRVALHKWSHDETIHAKGHLVVVLSRYLEDLDSKLLDRCGCMNVIRIPKPKEDERCKKIQELGFSEEISQVVARVTAGLSLKEIISALAGQDPSAALDDLLKEVFQQKRQILNDEYGDLMEILNPELGFDIMGGLEGIVGKLKCISEAMRLGKTSLVPQGILFMGPPGTGKTLLGEAFACDAKINFARLLDIKSKWVGDSERNMTRLINALKDLAPIVIFVDEFDQSQGDRGSFDGDSGVSRNLMKKMLEVMGDVRLRGKLLWIFATNRPDLIDAAMKRPGRCDLRIPFIPPDVSRLEKICQAAFKQYPEMKHQVKNWRIYAERCLGYSGADIVEVVRRAWEQANVNGREAIVDEDMDWACEDYRPQSLDRTKTARMTLIALMECSSKSLMPENWQKAAVEAIADLTGQRPEQLTCIDARTIQSILDQNR